MKISSIPIKEIYKPKLQNKLISLYLESRNNSKLQNLNNMKSANKINNFRTKFKN